MVTSQLSRRGTPCVTETTGPGVWRPGFQVCLGHCLTEWPWPSHLSPLGFWMNWAPDSKCLLWGQKTERRALSWMPITKCYCQTLNRSSSPRSNDYQKRGASWASLVAQRLRICLPMQGTRVRALVWGDPTCRRATRPVSHNYGGCASGACAPQQERPRQWEACAPRWRVAPACRN